MRSLVLLATLAVACRDDDCDIPSVWYADLDGDGYGDETNVVSACDAPTDATDEGGDCDDTVRATNPSAVEICDGVDNDCDGTADVGAIDGDTWYTDADRDGYGDDDAPVTACDGADGLSAAGGDCDDGDDDIHPDALEPDCTDPVDYNCDGSTGYADADGDGWLACEDCDDGEAAANPSAQETCDGIDDDCDGEIDEGVLGLWYADADGDGYGDASSVTEACEAPPGTVADATDCDDADAAFHPGADESCADPEDHNCDGSTGYADADGDGWAACEDCDDGADAANPGAGEVCDGIDDDCDGEVDEADAADAGTWYADTDGDGSGEAATAVVACDAPAGYVADPGDDCDPADPTVYPGAPELCDGQRNDCDAAAWTTADEAGHVSAERASGAWTDLTSTFSAGTSSVPASDVLPSDGTVWICDGTYYTTLTAPAGATVTVEARDGDVVLDGADAGPVLTAESSADVTLVGLTLRHGLGVAPADGSSSNTYGGGVHATDAAVALTDVTLADNAATYGGGAYTSGGTLVLDGATVTGNVATYGGGLYTDSTEVASTGATLTGNTATSTGGALYFRSTGSRGLLVQDGELTDDYAPSGGAIYVYSSGSGSAEVDGATISGNVATYGGGLYFNASGTARLLLSGADFADNVASYSGGGAYASMTATADLTVDGSTFSGNEAVSYYGGGLFVSASGLATLSVTGGAAFSDNVADDYGGALYDSSSSWGAIVLEDVDVGGNLAGFRGAGILLSTSSDVTLTRVSVVGNEVTDTSTTRHGAGLYVSGDGVAVTLTDCDVSDNTFASATTSTAYGAGIYAETGTLDLVGTTVDGNSGYYGGGLYVGSVTALTTDAGTLITDNTALYGGGVYLGSTASYDCVGSPAALAGFLANTASSRGGGVYLSTTSNTLTGTDCDTGAGGSDNVANGSVGDVWANSSTYTWGNDATFSCSSGACY